MLVDKFSKDTLRGTEKNPLVANSCNSKSLLGRFKATGIHSKIWRRDHKIIIIMNQFLVGSRILAKWYWWLSSDNTDGGTDAVVYI